MTDYPDLPRDHNYVSITRSELDGRVWVPHIPFSDIATSECMATTSIRRAKAYTERFHEAEPGAALEWRMVSPDMWVLFEEGCD